MATTFPDRFQPSTSYCFPDKSLEHNKGYFELSGVNSFIGSTSLFVASTSTMILNIYKEEIDSINIDLFGDKFIIGCEYRLQYFRKFTH